MVWYVLCCNSDCTVTAVNRIRTWVIPATTRSTNHYTITAIWDPTGLQFKQSIMSGPRQRKLPTASDPTAEKLKFYTDLRNEGTKPVILSLVPQFSKSYRPQALDKKYTDILSESHDEDCGSLQRNVLLKHCDNAFSRLIVTEDEAVNCEITTREQGSCKQWFHFRTGRITASRAKRVCRTGIENPSKSLIKDICYPVGKKYSSKAAEWGCEHEKKARKSEWKQNDRNTQKFSSEGCRFCD